MKEMKRRNFIVLTTASAAAVAAPIWYYNYSNVDYAKSLTQPLLLSKIWDTETIKEIGQLYKRKYPNENNERKLVKLLLDGISTGNGSTDAAIAKRIKQDFETGSVVTIDGWILSTTEGRQCALYSLSNHK